MKSDGSDTYVDEGPRDDPGRPHQRRDHPGGNYHDNGTAGGPPDSVLERTSNAHEPVKADQQQVRYGRVADRVVQRQPCIAHHRPCRNSKY